MKSIFSALVAIIFTLAQPANAVDILGKDSPAFQSALQDWLDGKDMAALTQLAELARQDNRAAQIFLARIAEETHLHRHVTGSLPRAERVALLRQPGGLSGKSWLTAAQEDVPLAKAILQANRIRERQSVGPTLLEYGETTLALRLVRTLIEHWNFAEARETLDLMDPKLGAVKVMIFAVVNKGAMGRPLFGPKEFRYKHRTDPVTGISVIDQMGAYSAARWGSFEDAGYREIVLSAVDQVLELQPAVNWCKANCASSVPRCVFAASFSNSDKYGPFSSPLESLLPNEIYWTSLRIDADIARTAPNLTKYRNSLRKFDACFVDKMTALQARVR